MLHNYYDIHTHQKNKERALINITLPIDNEFFIQKNQQYSVGWHPWYIAAQEKKKIIQKLQDLVAHQEVWAIGETGLDRAVPITLDWQKEIFLAHTEISEHYHKPLIIHCVRAYNEILALHKLLKPQQRWILHGFRANENIAKDYQKRGIFLSFGESLLHSQKLQKTFCSLDISLVFFETDTSSTDIASIYQKAAFLKKMEEKELVNTIKRNLCNIFSFL